MTIPSCPPGWLQLEDVFASAAGGRRVRALMTARAGGVSQGAYAACNLGDHVQDDPRAVAQNRAAVQALMGGRPCWLTQVHGRRLVRLTRATCGPSGSNDVLAGCFNPEAQGFQPQADGAFTTEPGLVCVVMVADCLPVLLAAPEGRGVAALHAGWRGLAGAGDMGGRGIVHTGVPALCEATSCDPRDLLAWLGPCIGPSQFEVGADVLTGFGVKAQPGKSYTRFQPIAGVAGDARHANAPKWLADLPGLARDVLTGLGVHQVNGGQWCTVSDASRFFSFRRDRITGRQAACISLA